MELSLSDRQSTQRRPYVLALGDSLTAGYGLPATASFAARLEARVRADFPTAVVHNAGVSGDTAGAALCRLPALLTSLPVRPDLAVVELGANDLLRGVPPARTRADLGAILEELERCGIPVVLATLEPPLFLAGFARPYRSIYDELAGERGVRAHPFFPPGVLGHPDYVLADGIHPNAAAIDRAARELGPVIVGELMKWTNGLS